MVAVCHAAERGHRLALGAGRHEDDLLRGQVVGLLGVDQDAVGHLEVAEVGGDAHVAHHRAAHERDATLVRVGGVDDLLDAVHVAGKGRDDDAAGGVREQPVERRRNFDLGRREAGDLRVGGVHLEEVDALLAEAGKGAQVGDAAVERQLVHLEVAGVEDRARGRAHEDRKRIWDRVVDRDELEVEGLDLLPLTLLDAPA